MSDFLLQFGSHVHFSESTEALLRDRPGLSERAIERYSFGLGQAVVQRSADYRYDPFQDEGGVFIAIGRPILPGFGTSSDERASFCRCLASMWKNEGAHGVFDRLSGMYVVARIQDKEVELITDLMGIRPVYCGRNADDEIVAIGSFAEATAAACGRFTDFDAVSLGELLVYRSITYPYTSRHGIRELAPGAIHRFRLASDRLPSYSHEIRWVPTEPTHFASETQLGRELESAIRESADDLTRDIERAAVTLSGGRDSRLILAALPPAKRAGAITFVTRENRETAVARQIADSLHVDQLLAHRDPEFYSDLLVRGTQLLGTELRADAHGLCITDHHLDEQFDVIIGGQLSDTYLKDHFMPRDRKEALRPKGRGERMKRVVKGALGIELRRSNGRSFHSAVRDPIEFVREEIAEAMKERRRQRLEEVRQVRPRSAEEWINFWPTSRQNDTSHILGNSRLYSADGLFMHRHIIETAVRLPDELCYRGRLANEVFARVYQELGSIVNANTGLPAVARMSKERQRERKLIRDAAAKEQFTRLEPSAHPWNDVQNSWVDFELLQKGSPRWQSYREELTDRTVVGSAEAGALLEAVIRDEPMRFLSQYRGEWGPLVNRVAMQIAMHAARCFARVHFSEVNVCATGSSEWGEEK